MLKHHHHNGAPVSPSRRRRSHLHQTSSRSVPEVGIIPGNRFFLLPLRTVTALVRPHTPCREPSATRTKPCIVSKPKQASSPWAEIHSENRLQELYVRSQAHSKSSRSIAKQRRRRTTVVAKTRLSPVCEQAGSVVAEQERLLEYERLLWNDGRLVDGRLVDTRNCRNVGVSNRSRAKDSSIFTFGETTLQETCRGASLAASCPQMLQELNLKTAPKRKKKRSNSFSHSSDIDFVLYRSSRKTHTKSRFSVSTSTETECVVSGGCSFGRNNTRVSPSSLSHSQRLHPAFGPGNDSATSYGKADDLETPRVKKRSNSRATSFGKADDLDTPRSKNRRNFSASSFGKTDDLETPRSKSRRDSRAASFCKTDDLETPRNKNRSNFRAASFSKVEEFVTPRNKNRSKSSSNFTFSTKADAELVSELKTPWSKDISNFRDNSATSFSKADELVTLCDTNRSNFRGDSAASFDNLGDEIVKPCDKNRRKSRGHHRRTSSGKADEILIRDKKRRNFSLWGCSHQIRSCSPFLCSFTNKNDLPIGPSPLRLSRRSQNQASVAQGVV